MQGRITTGCARKKGSQTKSPVQPEISFIFVVPYSYINHKVIGNKLYKNINFITTISISIAIVLKFNRNCD